MKLRININAMFCDLHCPGCGGTDFSAPAFIEKGWFRCKNCGVDLKYDNTKGGLDLAAVVESFRNRVHERFDQRQQPKQPEG